MNDGGFMKEFKLHWVINDYAASRNSSNVSVRWEQY